MFVWFKGNVIEWGSNSNGGSNSNSWEVIVIVGEVIIVIVGEVIVIVILIGCLNFSSNSNSNSNRLFKYMT